MGKDTEDTKISPEASILEHIRGWLKSGATIRATDPNGRILEILPDGSCYGGLTVKGDAK